MAGLAAQVYGEALLRTGEEKQEISELFREAGEIISIWKEHPEYEEILVSAEITRDEKIHILEETWKDRVSEDMMGFLIVMTVNNRPGEIRESLKAFMGLVREREGIGRAYVTSAKDLNRDQKKQIEERLLETTGYKKLSVYYHTNPALIGGIVIRIKDRVADGSLKTKLESMRRDLVRLNLK